jgi:hypothetical protein
MKQSIDRTASPFWMHRSAPASWAPALLLLLLCVSAPAQRPKQPPKPSGPWMNTSLSPDERADLVIKQMTLDEKIATLHGVGMPTDDPLTAENMPSNRGVGYEVGVPRLGIPGIDMSDAAYGVRSSGANGRYSTALPANVAAAASWDTDAAYEYGKLIGTEALRVERPGERQELGQHHHLQARGAGERPAGL